MQYLGIDIGGSGIKYALVNPKNGELLSDRIRVNTPKKATPKAIKNLVKDIVTGLNYTGPVGCSFPSVVKNGKCLTAANISTEWIGVQVDELFKSYCGNLFYVINDADAACIAEMKLGTGNNVKGKVVLVTIGTGLGSGLFMDGKLIPNIELGQVYYKKEKPIEQYAASSARVRENLNLKRWTKRFDYFLNYINRVMQPDLFIIGGGISRKFKRFEQYLTCPIPIKVAYFRNNAGIIGATIYALENLNGPNK